MGKDLGTYHLRVELEDGRGWIETWRTGYRFTRENDGYTGLNAMMIPPLWGAEGDVLANMVWQYTEGKCSCDCRKQQRLAKAYRQPDDGSPCGNTLRVKRLTAIRPDGSEVVVYGSFADREVTHA